MVCISLWWLPVFLAGWWHGWDGTLFQEGVFFSKASMVTFGGAYAVLPYVAQQAVETHSWLTAPQMLVDGLAFAETTPGPLIMVLQHVGFMGGWHQPGWLNPLVAATLGALLTTWVTFVPSADRNGRNHRTPVAGVPINQTAFHGKFSGKDCVACCSLSADWDAVAEYTTK